MSEANKRFVIEFLTELCAGNAAHIADMMTDDVQAVAVGTASISATRDKETIVRTCEAFPVVTQSGLNPTIVTAIAEGETVAIEWRGNCTLANGTPYNNEYAMIFTMRDGKIAHFREYFCTKLADEVLAPLLYAQVGQA